MKKLVPSALIFALGTLQGCAPQRSSELQTREQTQPKQGSATMSDDWGKRETALAIGVSYCVQREVAGKPGRSAFQLGEMVRLIQVAYSRYDNMHDYTFESRSSGPKSFWLGDAEPIDRLKATFKRC